MKHGEKRSEPKSDDTSSNNYNSNKFKYKNNVPGWNHVLCAPPKSVTTVTKGVFFCSEASRSDKIFRGRSWHSG